MRKIWWLEQGESIEAKRLAERLKAQRFYSSQAWTKAREYKLSLNPLCEVCGKNPGLDVHHIIKLKDDWSKRLDLDNLLSVDRQCHANLDKRKNNFNTIDFENFN